VLVGPLIYDNAINLQVAWTERIVPPWPDRPTSYLALLECRPGALDLAAPLEGWELPA
jgi:hypothetical protein